MHVVLRLAFLSILVLQSALSQSVIVLQPDATCGKDAMVCDDPLYMKSLRNYGDNPDLLIYAWTDLGGPVYARSYLDFPLPPIADPSQVLSAKLSLFNSSDSPELEGKHWPMTGSNAGWIRRVTGAWDEHGITWANQPSSTDLRKVDIPRSLNAHQNYIDIDVTPLIRDIISDPAHGHGLVVMLQNEQEYRALVFASSDNEVPERHPRLVLELSDNKPWGPVTISIEGPSKVDFAGGHFQPNPITLRCTLTNTGSVAVELSNVHLFFQGLTALDPVLLRASLSRQANRGPSNFVSYRSTQNPATKPSSRSRQMIVAARLAQSVRIALQFQPLRPSPAILSQPIRCALAVLHRHFSPTLCQ